ncbi:hypothetical protein RNJ44_04983 [Nakaseomyces bracarensis]|uniref:Uncharacterized protein n=1 Tax=Nakaseomyces bracarensis TaxID=273131 RepID=A0ABR4NWG8_9SACH
MSNKDRVSMPKPLGDIGNTVGNKDARNVFERLSLSPKKRVPDKVVWKPAVRVSPNSKGKNGMSALRNVNETPKRLSTPPFLREYSSRITQSLDRPHFDSNSSTKSNSTPQQTSAIMNTPTNLIERSNLLRGSNTDVFLQPISPTKITFSNEKRRGGDGSSSRILSRIRNIRASPLRTAAPLPQAQPIKRKNLTQRLREEEEGLPKKRVRFQMPNQPQPNASYLRPTSSSNQTNENRSTNEGSGNKSDTKNRRPNSRDSYGVTTGNSQQANDEARIRALENTVRALEARIKQLEEIISKT